jgi:hypothetical protein
MWWLEHQKEIEFAFKVLAGLGLVEFAGTTEDDTVAWVPLAGIGRLYRAQQSYYFAVREEQLKENVAYQIQHSR